MDELNDPSDWEDVDVSLVVGANDTVPWHLWRLRTVVVDISPTKYGEVYGDLMGFSGI